MDAWEPCSCNAPSKALHTDLKAKYGYRQTHRTLLPASSCDWLHRKRSRSEGNSPRHSGPAGSSPSTRPPETSTLPKDIL
ncbi:hypothetical protein GCM10010302_00820 [Streptomyces polychromogenes]|uniref:Transposase n=1 Tax=Streptomyces polychromogenes TaxID=67342 RepID=A0ABP3ENH6_9ACTN